MKKLSFMMVKNLNCELMPEKIYKLLEMQIVRMVEYMVSLIFVCFLFKSMVNAL